MAMATATKKPQQRVLACVLCQQRKVKCDRKFPCANCVKAGAQCVPSAQNQRPRRRRFPERELLERLRHYESLLRKNSIAFEPMHPPSAEEMSFKTSDKDPYFLDSVQSRSKTSVPSELPQKKTAVNSEGEHEAKSCSPWEASGSIILTMYRSIWHAMNQVSQNPEDSDDNEVDDGDASDSSLEDVRPAVLRKALDQTFNSNDHLLFGSRHTNIDLSTLHPNQIQIFRLWQIYLDNVNPLLKVTHTPTLQARIIDAADDLASISPTLEALMFSIYCISILSLDEDECHKLFGLPRKDLLTTYHFGCQQALLNCEVLRSNERDCLTALFFYLVSVRPDTDPRSLSSMLAVAIRLAQRIGIQKESLNAKCTALEAEMRRRLWWALVIFDARMSELSAYKAAMIAPVWHCRTPLNVNDFDLQPEMKIPPLDHGNSTDAIFAVVRSEMVEFIRNCAFHLDFLNPALKSVAKDVQRGPIPEGGEMVTLERMIEDKYLRFCNPENPLHFMTIWTARGYMAKNRLVEHYSRYSTSSLQQSDEQRKTACSYALRMLESDTKLMTSPLTKGYFWLIHLQFPFPAYIHLVQDLRKHPFGEHVEKCWEVMSDNYEARFLNKEREESPFFKVLYRIVIQAWAARNSNAGQLNELKDPPRIVLNIKRKLEQRALETQSSTAEQTGDSMGLSGDDFLIPMPLNYQCSGLPYDFSGQSVLETAPDGFTDILGAGAMDLDTAQQDWTTIDWNPMHGYDW